MTKQEQHLMSECGTTSVCPRGVASCGTTIYGSDAYPQDKDLKWTCTLMRGHTGPHIAHGYQNIPARVWR